MMPQNELRVSFVNISFKHKKILENSHTSEAFEMPGMPYPAIRDIPNPLIAIK